MNTIYACRNCKATTVDDIRAVDHIGHRLYFYRTIRGFDRACILGMKAYYDIRSKRPLRGYRPLVIRHG